MWSAGAENVPNSDSGRTEVKLDAFSVIGSCEWTVPTSTPVQQGDSRTSTLPATGDGAGWQQSDAQQHAPSDSGAEQTSMRDGIPTGRRALVTTRTDAKSVWI